MSAREPSEEELRAAYEAELKKITTGDILLQTVVTLVNLGGGRLGLAPGSDGERDLDQARDAIDAVRALLPILEREGAPELPAIREALSQLQLAFTRVTGIPGHRAGEPAQPAPDPSTAPSEGAAPSPAAAPPAGEAAEPAAPQGAPGDRAKGPAESSGRLWVPGR
jgi:hypothetical protein